MTTATDEFLKRLLNERDEIISKHDALVEVIEDLADALEEIVELSDLEMKDGDGAREIAEAALADLAKPLFPKETK